ncbi:pyridoxamine kinase [Clostridium sp. 19966]|uniref:pyridoxamine kinase n=1 Tax=Clostridium sp. 19966 TaxID=2768166 RepID=UPI0028DDA971|nr:pyridoxamine kinase [Clostridium sp. 19966]MDT8718666.1 pyridoxamine kinase [Clostridium sp. 19966]
MRKRIAAIHDLACYGGAALMNIIPIMYNLGVEVNPIPTAIFTSHGAFNGVKKTENDAFMKEYLFQWKSNDFKFDGIYIGLFTSPKQVEFTKEFLDSFKHKDTLVVLDPILGDNGKLYGFMDEDSIENVKAILEKADVITPNLTEAALLTGMDYKKCCCEEEIEKCLKVLGKLGPKYVIITSVCLDDKMYIYIYDKTKDSVEYLCREKLKGSYPGTGDAFTAVLMGCLMKGMSICESAEKAAEFVEAGISLVISNNLNPLEGLPLADIKLTSKLKECFKSV